MTNYLQAIYCHYVNASIIRMANSGGRIYTYNLSVQEIKNNTNRTRLHQTGVIDFFSSLGAEISYNDNQASFLVVIDLDRCVLNAQQAKDYGCAMNYHHNN